MQGRKFTPGQLVASVLEPGPLFLCIAVLADGLFLLGPTRLAYEPPELYEPIG